VTVSVDTNVLLELLEADAASRRRAEDDLNALEDEQLIICEAVFAELANQFPDIGALEEFLGDTGITFVPSDPQVLFLAGRLWVNYARTRPAGLVCSECGRVTAATCGYCDSLLSIRQRVLPDFYVGAHALAYADRLLTRDKRHFQTYFPEVPLV